MQDSFIEKRARKNYCRNQTQPLNMMSCQLWQRLQCKRCLRAIVQTPRLGLRFLIRRRRVNLQNKPRTSRCVFFTKHPCGQLTYMQDVWFLLAHDRSSRRRLVLLQFRLDRSDPLCVPAVFWSHAGRRPDLMR